MPDALTVSPPADLWTQHMRAGAWDAAWSVSDAVLASRRGVPCHHWPRHCQYVWDGTPLAGRRVLVRCYHGLGDTIQFVRYARPLREIAREVIVWAQPVLLRLLECVDGIDRLLPLHDGAPDADYDIDMEVMELPHAFRSTETTLPRTVPYLDVPAAGRPAGLGLHAGIVWTSGEWDPRRSIPYTELAPLLSVPGVYWHVLQQAPRAHGWCGARGTDAGRDDVYELARTMRSLDLIVTVDSMPAHLAGALGLRTWTLLHADADWRWGVSRDDSVWYPTMRLMRQETPHDWRPVIERAADLLRADVSQRSV